MIVRPLAAAVLYSVAVPVIRFLITCDPLQKPVANTLWTTLFEIV